MHFIGILYMNQSVTESRVHCMEMYKNVLKVSLKFSFEPKNQQKYFCTSALASKSGRIKKTSDKYMINSNKLVFCAFIFCFNLFLGLFLKLVQKYKDSFVGFLVQMKTLEFALEIY